MQENNLKNMTNTNEVENNVMINNQGNNSSNNNLRKVLIAIVIILILGLIMLTLYVVLDKKDDNIDSNKDNVQEENKDNSNVDNNEKDYAKLEKKMLDEYYLKTTDIIDEHILEYRYSAIVNNEVTYEEFYKAYTTKNIMNSLKPVSGCNVNSNNQDVEYDKNGVKYPMYCTEDTPFLDCVEEYAKELGLTVEEISKIDKSVWPELPGGGGGGYCNNVYDAKEIKEKYLDIYNNIFKTSFKIYLSNELNGPTNGYIYDKNIDKIMNDGYGGTPIFNERVIINSNEENNLYKVRFVEGTFSPSEGGKWIESSINEEISKNDENEARELIKRNKDKLPNYEVIFEKTSTGYKYKSIRKIETKEENQKNISTSISPGDCGEDICEYYIKLSGEVKTLKYETIKDKDINIRSSMNLYLNGKKIHSYKSVGYSSFSKDYIDVFNDLIVLYDYEKIIIFDKNGNIIREFYELEEINGMVPGVTNVPRYEQIRKLSDYSYIPYSIENNKLKIYGTRYVDGGCSTINDGINSMITLTDNNDVKRINDKLELISPLIAIYEIDYSDIIFEKNIVRTKILQTLDDALKIDFSSYGSGNACQLLF